MGIKKHVVIAAGHGGGDSGAVARGTTEAHQTIQITGRLVDKLKNDGRIDVTHVPDSLGLVATIAWINKRQKKLKSAISIEIHKNSGGGTGCEVWTPSYPDSTSKKMAKDIAKAMAKSTGLRNRGVKYAQNNRWGRLAFTDDTNTYAVLVEAGFIDVDSNSSKADDKYAEGIYQGLLKFYKLKPKKSEPKSKPVPKAVKLPKILKFKAELSPTKVWNLTTNPNYKAATVLRKGEPFEAYASIKFNNRLYYVTKYSYQKGLKVGVNSNDVVPIEKPKPVEPPKEVEEVKRTEHLKFSPAVKMVLTKNTPLLNIPSGDKTKGSDIYKAGKIIETVADYQEFSNGKAFYRTLYSVKGNNPTGYPADAIKDFVEPKDEPKPDYGKENNQLLKTILSLLQGLIDKISLIFK